VSGLDGKYQGKLLLKAGRVNNIISVQLALIKVVTPSLILVQHMAAVLSIESLALF
jgi:hypothetical protein